MFQAVPHLPQQKGSAKHEHKKHCLKTMLYAIKKLLGYFKRILVNIEALNACGTAALGVGRNVYQKHLVVSEFDLRETILYVLMAAAFLTAISAYQSLQGP